MTSEIQFPDVGGRSLWIEFEDRYAPYICFERSDAFLIAMLPIALRDHVDIHCEAPVGEILLYQIQTYLLPALVKGEPKFRLPNIMAEVDDTVYPTFAVGTGVSCGIDSFHSIKNGLAQKSKNLHLTHLTMFNVGAFYKKNSKQFVYQRELAEKVASESGLELVVANSNFTVNEFDKKLWHLHTHCYNNAFAIFALQKMWKTYFYASTYDISQFSVMNSEKGDPDHYSILFWDSMTTPSLRFYVEGAAITRFEKTRDLVDFAPARRYLNVCVDESGKNCGKCFKCLRTLLSLDALGALEKFENVFDIKSYREQCTENLVWMVRQKFLKKGDNFIDEAYELLHKKLPLVIFFKTMLVAKFENYDGLFRVYSWLRALPSRVICKVKRLIPPPLPPQKYMKLYEIAA